MSTTNNRITCKIKELGEWQFSHLTLTEKIGENIPTGELSFLQDPENEDLSIESLNIDLILNDEYQLSMKAFVEEATNHRGDNRWKLVFVPKSFYMNPHIGEFDGVKALLSKLSPYDFINSPSTDCGLDSKKLYQNNITDFTCLMKYLNSLKIDQVYTFRFDGLYFTDITQTPTTTLNIKGFARQIPIRIRRSKFLELKSSQYSLSTNSLTNVHYSNQVVGMSSDVAKAYMNYLQNTRTFKCLGDQISYEFPDYMNLRAGDLVKIIGTNYEENNYIVTENFLDITQGAIKNKLTFSSIS